MADVDGRGLLGVDPQLETAMATTTAMRRFIGPVSLRGPEGDYLPTTRPTSDAVGTGPHSRLSALWPRLSPITKT